MIEIIAVAMFIGAFALGWWIAGRVLGEDK